MKERQAQQDKITQIFILGTPLGGENPPKLHQYRIRPTTMNNPNKNTNFLSPTNLLTLSLLRTYLCETCVNEGAASLIYTHQMSDLIT